VDAYDISRFRFLFVVQAQYRHYGGSSSWGDPYFSLDDRAESCSSRNEVQIKNAPSDLRGLSPGEKLNPLME